MNRRDFLKFGSIAIGAAVFPFKLPKSKQNVYIDDGTSFAGEATKFDIRDHQHCYWGDGSDGNVYISGTVELQREMYYNDLTLTKNSRLITNGHRVYVRGFLNCEGTVG